MPLAPNTISRKFQSSPTPKGGRYLVQMHKVDDLRLVSILAHPERWALPCGFVPSVAAVPFQSSPTPKGGRYSLM